MNITDELAEALARFKSMQAWPKEAKPSHAEIAGRAARHLEQLQAQLRLQGIDLERLRDENRNLRAELLLDAPPWRDTLAEVVDIPHSLQSILASQPPIYLCDAVKLSDQELRERGLGRGAIAELREIQAEFFPRVKHEKNAG